MVDKKQNDEEVVDEDLVSVEEIQATVVDDGLDLDIVDEFKEEDFDEDFDDDFEEEIEGEYALQDDKYGKEFDENFGHLTDPSRARKKAPAPPPEDEEETDASASEKTAEKKPVKKAAAKKKATKKVSRKK